MQMQPASPASDLKIGKTCKKNLQFRILGPATASTSIMENQRHKAL